MQLTRQRLTVPALAQGGTTVRATSSIHCLVVAPNEIRCENLGFAAREGGWDVTQCRDVEMALAQARQSQLQMAIIDLSVGSDSENQQSPSARGLRFLIEQLASNSRMLLLVCGNLDDPCEEVWARHLGVWMYLPGAIDGAELVGLCAAARETVARLSGAERSRSGRPIEQRFL